jgi:FKBP-type peptidyl-prolyl cis-trans isomerase FkpA
MKRILMVLATVLSAACNLDTQPLASNNPSDPTTETFAANLKINIATMQKTANGTYYRDAVVGTGLTITGPQIVVMTYLGFLKDGSLFISGEQEQVSMSILPFGLQDAMSGMKEGGERVIVIPSALGYGPVQVGAVPPNSTLVFDVKLDLVP